MKVNVRGIEGLGLKVRRQFDKIRRDPKLLNQIGNTSVKYMLGTARSGKSPENGKKYLNLSNAWIAKRKYLLKYNTPGDLFLNSKKSNVTFTGQTIQAAYKFKIDQSKASVNFTPEGNHTGYKLKTGKTKSIPFSKLLGYLADQGRVILYINKKLEQRLNILVKSFVRKNLK